MTKAKFYSYFLVALGAAALGAYLRPTTGTKIEYRDKIVEQTKIVTKIVRVKAPDGSERTETVIVDGSTSTRDSRTSILKASQAQYVAGLGVKATYNRLSEPEYEALIGRRLVGPLWGSVTISTQKQVGLMVSLEF